MTPAIPPLFWIKQVYDALAAVKEIPLWGFMPPFPLDALSKKIAECLDLPDVTVSVKHAELKTAQDIYLGLGANPLKETFELMPLPDAAYWLMSQEDVGKLCALALGANKGFSSSSFREGFLRFLCLQIVEVIDELHAFGDLSVKIASSRPIPKEDALCIDIALQVPKHTLWGRLICSASFRQSLKAHFSTPPSSLLENAFAKDANLTLRAEIAHTTLSLSEWKKVTVGDFIALDACSFDLSTHKGNATLMLNQTALLRARLKGESIKIIDYAFYYEESMNEDPLTEPEEEREFPPAQKESNEQQEESHEHLWAHQEGELGVDQLIPTEEIPLLLTVEVARLTITLEKLLQLQPGNVLELPIRPEQGVVLLIGGRKVAKAELIKLGDVLGVKILQRGD